MRNLPANATCAGRESYLSDKSEGASWRADSRASRHPCGGGTNNFGWDDRTDRMTFEVQKGDTTVRSVWTNSVRNALRRQAGWAKLQKVRARAATHWTARAWYRHNQRWLQASKEGAEASKSGSFKDEREWGRKCLRIWITGEWEGRQQVRGARTSSSEKDPAEKKLESG